MANDEEIRLQAIAFAKENKQKIAGELTDTSRFPPDTAPVSVFMAGSPGAGKTESSQRLIERFSSDGHSILRIDSDDLRGRFPGYNGQNSSLFQAATSIIADRMQDMALKQNQSYVFDGTLSNLERARENITRSIHHGRFVQIIYVYQDPQQAWEFVKARELRDGRMIPKDAFIEQFCTARSNVDALKQEFGTRIAVDVIVKNIDGSDFSYFQNIDQIDRYIPERYTQNVLQDLIKSV